MIKTIIFDLGGVLIDWNPRYLYSKIFEQEAEMEHFLGSICTGEWNEEQDGGRTLEEGTKLLLQQYPEHEQNIRAFYGRWSEMLGGALEDTVAIFKKLKESGQFKLYALTNWSAETFPVAVNKFPFLNWFDGIVVSGTERNRKPFPEFYKLLLQRYSVPAGEALFIDDNSRNVDAARQVGIDSIRFENAGQLKGELIRREIRLKD